MAKRSTGDREEASRGRVADVFSRVEYVGARYVTEDASQLHIILRALWRHPLRVTMPTGSAKDSVSSAILGVK
jgi:hypothetical protein